jgi:hypothetical protein
MSKPRRISFKANVHNVVHNASYPLRSNASIPPTFGTGTNPYGENGPYENVPKYNLWVHPSERANAMASYRSETQERFREDPEFHRDYQLKPQLIKEHRASVRNRLAGPRINGFFVPPPGWNVRAAAGKTLKNSKKPSGINRRSVKNIKRNRILAVMAEDRAAIKAQRDAERKAMKEGVKRWKQHEARVSATLKSERERLAREKQNGIGK